jgi:hypothetical protein
MRVSYVNNVLTVVTDISEDTVKKGIAPLYVKDDKQNELYRVKVSTKNPDAANITKFGLTCNAFVDGKAAVIMVLPAETELEDVQRAFGEALVEATKYTGIIASAAAEKEAAIADIFNADAE